jgi:signal transduction histidine kinase
VSTTLTSNQQQRACDTVRVVPGDRDALGQSRGIRYGVAVVVTLFALFARFLMTPEWGISLPFITLYPGIAFAAWFGGFGPGVLTTCLGALAVASFWPAHFGGTSTAGDALALLLFGAVGVFVSGLTRALHQAREKAERTAEDLRRAREEAERANHAKDEFLAVVAHELKQPLSAMLPAVSLIRNRMSPESLASTERTLDLVNRQITHLQRVVNDLLDASRVVRGQVTLQPRVVDAFQIVRDAVEVIRPRAQERQQRLVVDVSGSTASLNVDPVRLQQVLLNVLANASAYTPPGGEICISANRDTTRVVFRVRDSGEGIAADDLARIFGLFTRAGGRREGGFGIGLAVARSLVELHGGTIDAYSEGPGRGSEFRITLPAQEAPRAIA